MAKAKKAAPKTRKASPKPTKPNAKASRPPIGTKPKTSAGAKARPAPARSVKARAGKAPAGKARPAARRGSGKRELIDTGVDKRYVRRSGSGQFTESDDVSRSLSADRRRKAKTAAKPGQGDRGDRKHR